MTAIIIGSFENPSTTLGMEHSTSQFVAQYFNQLRYHVPQLNNPLTTLGMEPASSLFVV
jgi:hypothetical protein